MRRTRVHEEPRPHAETHCIAWSGDAVLLLPLYSSARGHLAEMTGVHAEASLTSALFALARIAGALRCQT